MDTLTIIRHAQTDWSLQGRHTGLTDIPLNQTGEKEAKALKTRLQRTNYHSVFVSPLKRALDTAKLAGLFDKAVIDADLVEWDYGVYEGLTIEEIHQKDPEWTIFTKGGPGGESVEAATIRAEKVLKKLHQLPGDLLIVSSAHFSRLLTACYLGSPPQFGLQILLYPASCSVLGQEKGFPAIISWNHV